MIGIHKPYSTPYRYYIQGFDVTFFIVNKLELPKGLNDLYFEVIVK